MVETKQIKLITESSGISKTGNPYVRYEFEFEDGFKLSTFNKDFGTVFKCGQVVDIETEQKGQYTELKSMKLSDKNTEDIKKVAENGSKPVSREKSIIAQTLTKCWAEMNEKFDYKQVLNTYNYFLENL